MKFKEIVKLLQDDGWEIKGVRGPHYQFVHPIKPGKITVPCHGGDLDKRTAKTILSAAGLDMPRKI